MARLRLRRWRLGTGTVKGALPRGRTASMKVGILFSGEGKLMGALMRAAISPSYPASFVLALTNRPNAGGIEVARRREVPVRVIDGTGADDDAAREAHEDEITAALKTAGVQLVCLAGYNRILSERFVKAWRGKILSLHPALLPAFRGVDTHARAVERHVRVHGCTVLYVNSELDGGPIVAQAVVPVFPSDDADTLKARVDAQAERLYPRCVALVAQNKVRWTAGEVVPARDLPPDALLTLPEPPAPKD